MDDDLGPGRVNSIIAVVLIYLLDRRQLVINIVWDFVSQAYTTLEVVEFFDTHLAVEHPHYLLVMDPSENQITHGPAVSLFELLP